MNERVTPEEWIGERIWLSLDTDEEVKGILQGTTEHGVIVNVTGRGQDGPAYYGWRHIRWLYPVDRQS